MYMTRYAKWYSKAAVRCSFCKRNGVTNFKARRWNRNADIRATYCGRITDIFENRIFENTYRP